MSTEINNQSDEISLKELIQKIREWYRYLKTQWWKIAIAGIIGGVIGFVYALMQPITYTAKTTFVVEDPKSSGSGFSGLASLAGQFGVDVGGSSGGGLFSGDNILLYFKSPSLAREVLLSKYDSLSNKSVADVYSEIYKLKEVWEKNENIGKINFIPVQFGKPYTRLQDSLIKKITESILAKQLLVSKTEKKAGFIDVVVTMENEVLAKIFCERIVDIAVNRYTNIKIQRQKNTVDKLQARVDSVARLLNQKTVSGASLQTSTNIMDINPLYKANTIIATETTVRDKTMLAAIFGSLTQNLELAKFTLSQETPVIQIIDNVYYPLNFKKASKLKYAFLTSILSVFVFATLLALKKLIKNILI
ncbi:MAG: hypothetical protein K2X26_06855 [Chitinophagaceae bacterium]|nr:hypothetical protein [Chitinophagaceae bacterium]